MVGGIGIEPMTSSVSGKRSPTELTAHASMGNEPQIILGLVLFPSLPRARSKESFYWMLVATNVLPLQLPYAVIERPGINVPLTAPREIALLASTVMMLKPCTS